MPAKEDQKLNQVQDTNPGKSPVGRIPRASGMPHGIYNNFGFEFFNAVFYQSLATPLLLFIRHSGGSAFMIGLTSAIPLLVMPLVLSVSRLIEKFGYRRSALTFWALRWVFSASLILIALVKLPGEGTWRAWAALGVLVFYHLFRNLGFSGYIPWLSSIVSARSRGLFLSRTTLFANLGGIFTFLVVGALLGNSPEDGQFGQVFIFATLGGLLSTFFMARIAPAPSLEKGASQTGPPKNFFQRVKYCFTRPGFTTFLAIQTFYGWAFFGIPSLSLIYLREKLEINPNLILYFSTAGIIGVTGAAILWGRLIDRYHSALPLQLLAFCGLSFNSFLWLLLKILPPGMAVWLVPLPMFLGAAWISALNMSQTTGIMALAPEEDRVFFQNIANFSIYSSQALAPAFWGFALDFMGQRQFKLDFTFYELGPYQIFFGTSLITGLIGAYYIYKHLHSKYGESL